MNADIHNNITVQYYINLIVSYNQG